MVIGQHIIVPPTGTSSITWTVHLSYRTRFATCDKLKVFESCPKAPLSARSQNDKIHLIKNEMDFFAGSGGRIRTCGQSITLIQKFPKGVDYIITTYLKGEAGARRFQLFRAVLPLGIVSEPSIQLLGKLGC